MIKRIVNNKTLLAFILSLILGSIIVVPNIIYGHGIFSLMSDFNYQQIPFNKAINFSIKKGSILWTWYNDLGSNFIGTFSFYNLLSPFNIIAYFFPPSLFEYLIGPIYILKYAVAGLTSYLFLKRYVKDKNYAIIGSLLYTFSGFQFTNILFYHFHDVVALFPLLLYTIDNLVYDDKRGRFALVVALLAITNWFFFIGEVVFVVIYFLVKLFTKSYQINLSKFFQIVFEGFIGILISAFILIPSYLFVIDNPRMDQTWTLYSMTRFKLNKLLEIFRAFIFPADNMNHRSLLKPENFKSVELYLPVVGVTLALARFIHKPKDFSSVLMLILGIMMIIPILNSTFFLFNTVYYARWFYMPTLILSLMSIQCLDESSNINNGIVLTLFAHQLFVIGLFTYDINHQLVIFEKLSFIIIYGFGLINFILMSMLPRIKEEKKKIIFLLATIFIFVSIYGNFVTFRYKRDTNASDLKYYFQEKELLLKYGKDRTNGSEKMVNNLGLINHMNYIKVFNSNINGSSFEFNKSLKIPRKIYTDFRVNNKLLNDFLGVKYVIALKDEKLEKYGYILKEENEKYKIYYNADYKEFGFSPQDYINSAEFKRLSFKEKQQILNDCIVLNDDQIREYKTLYDVKNYDYDIIDFKYIKNGFESEINSSVERLGVYQVPYDRGWTALNNGKKVEIEKVDNGLMAIKMHRGNNRIVFRYFPPGLKEGLVLSAVGSLMWLVYRKEKK